MNKLALIFAFLFSLSCTDSVSIYESMQEGIILHLAPPDNCNDFVLKIQDQIYFPKQLQNSFKKDSLLVDVELSKTDDFHSCGFGGSIPIIEITSIKIRN